MPDAGSAKRFHEIWVAGVRQYYPHFPDPKPSYVADWADLPDWHKETDADIFERIEKDIQLAR